MEVTHNLHINKLTQIPPLNDQTPHGRFGFVKAATGNAAFHAWVKGAQADTLETWEGIAEYAYDQELPVVVTGGMTNLFVTEEGFDGLLVTYRDNGQTSPIEFDDKTGEIRCSASTLLARLVEAACLEHERSLGNLAGIPGTVGGAVYGNAGRTVTKDNISDVVQKVVTFDLHAGREVVFNTKEPIDGMPFFGQRDSYFKTVNAQATRYVIRRIVADLGPERDEGARQLYAARIEEREGRTGRPGKNVEGEGTAGSIFVNGAVPPEVAAMANPGKNKPVLVRHLLKQVVIPGTGGKKLIDYEVNGASLTAEHAFLRTQSCTRDKDVAELLHTTLATLYVRYGFVPQLEIGILASQGLISLGEFIAKHNGGIDPLLCHPSRLSGVE